MKEGKMEGRKDGRKEGWKEGMKEECRQNIPKCMENIRNIRTRTWTC